MPHTQLAEAPNVENDAWFKRYSEADQAKTLDFVARMNAAYDAVKRDPLKLAPYAKWQKFLVGTAEKAGVVTGMDAYKRLNSAINLEAVYAMETTIARTIYQNSIGDQLFDDANAAAPGTIKFHSDYRHQIKEYLVKSKFWPTFTRNFRNPQFVSIESSDTVRPWVGLQFGVSMNWLERMETAGALWDPLAEMSRVAAEKMGIMRNRYTLLGTSCLGAQNDDGGTPAAITGLFNTASLQTAAAGLGGDNNIADPGDVENTLIKFLLGMKKVRRTGYSALLTTPGVWAEAHIQASTEADRLQDIDILKRRWVGPGNPIPHWYTDDALYAGVPNVAQQQAGLFQLGPGLFEKHVMLPQMQIPILDKRFEGDVNFVLIGGFAVYPRLYDTDENVMPGIKSSASMTASTVGWDDAAKVV